jgi:sugar-specific transcriptional regulator TrmB/DNA-binding CsgD family transcriptional regulator
LRQRRPAGAGPADHGTDVLSRLGVSPLDETLYRALLARPNTRLADLAAATGWDLARVRRHARSLEDLGLLTRTASRPARFTPSAPEAAFEVLALRRHEEIEQARVCAAKLADEFRTSGGGANPATVTVVRGREAVAHRFLQAQQATRHEVLILDKPPYVVKPYRKQGQVQRALLSKGVAYRTIYDQTALAEPEQLVEARDLAALGERGRVLADLPMKMVITDRSTAMVPFVLPIDQEVLVLQPSVLLDGLVVLFELLWQRATPLWPAGGQPGDVGEEGAALSVEDEQLLGLAASGLTDHAIARRLGKAQRTVERRMQRIMGLLGAQTRFQAGLQAASRGILGDPKPSGPSARRSAP